MPETTDGDPQEEIGIHTRLTNDECKMRHDKMVEWAMETIAIIENAP